MILKVERYNEDRGWWIVDSIARLSVSTTYISNVGKIQEVIGSKNVAEFNDEKFYHVHGDAMILDHLVHGGHITSDDEYKWMWLECRMKDNSIYTISFDTIAYILNDDGKTIERIAVNFNKINK